MAFGDKEVEKSGAYLGGRKRFADGDAIGGMGGGKGGLLRCCAEDADAAREGKGGM